MPKTSSPVHVKPVPKNVSKPTETAQAAATVAESVVAPAKVHKPKLVRDSFTMPKDEYQLIDVLKARALGLEKHIRKSELLRAGIQALAAMNDRAFLKAIGAVPTLKTGRPRAD
jgi:hypothetical protein